MTDSPSDLRAFRSTVLSITGITDGNSVGIVGDGAHQRTGGYHEGKDVLVANGLWSTDYSVRLTRDRNGCTNSASAIDVGYQWPHGGNAAWVRWNNSLASHLKSNDPKLSAIRAINYWNGSRKIRIDREYGWSEQSTTDTVDIHTHIEIYRDTEGSRQTTLDRVVALMQAAISNTNPDQIQEENVYVPFFAVRAPGKTAVTDIWVGNGIWRRQVIDADDWRVLQNMFWWNLGGKDDPAHQQGLTINENWTNLAALGVDIGAKPAVAITDAQVSALASAIGDKLIASHTNLTDADKPVIESAVSEAFRIAFKS